MSLKRVLTGLLIGAPGLALGWIGIAWAQTRTEAMPAGDVAIPAVADAGEAQVCSDEPALGDAADIQAVPLEVRPGYEVLALVDRKNQTLCIYQYDVGRRAHERLVLLAARSFRYDRLLEDYNTADPRPADIRQQVRPVDRPE